MRAEVLSSRIPTELDSFPPNQISSARVDVECPKAKTVASTIFIMNRILSSFPTARSFFTQEASRCRHTLFFTLRIELSRTISFLRWLITEPKAVGFGGKVKEKKS